MQPKTSKTLPVVAQILNDLTIVHGKCVLPKERMVHWAKTLRRDFGGAEHRTVYLQLGGWALDLATKKAPAALSLATLASLSAEVKQKLFSDGKKETQTNKLLGGQPRFAPRPEKASQQTAGAPTLKAFQMSGLRFA
ncbi:MAG: hypothetical protein HY791_08970 [Deltaproteobacteria bacterium]|nr:hypothetical protein [Deltaproteobacteria bacterium]